MQQNQTNAFFYIIAISREISRSREMTKHFALEKEKSLPFRIFDIAVLTCTPRNNRVIG